MDEQTESRIAQAEAIYEEAIEQAEANQLPSAIQRLKEAEELFQEVNHLKWLTFVRHEMFRLYLETGDLELATSLLPVIKESYNEIGDNQSLALVIIHEADLLYRLEETENALSKLRVAETVIQTHQLDSLKGYLNNTVAAVLMTEDRFADAINALETAIEHTPETSLSDRAWISWRLATCHRSIYQFQVAERFYNEAYKLFLQIEDITSSLSAMAELKDLYSARLNHEKERYIEAMIRRVNETWNNG